MEPFRSPYTGPNSLIPNQTGQTWDVTLYAGFRALGRRVNPEIDQGFGMSSTLGVAGFPSGEAYKIGAAAPYARIPRAFFRQTFDLGGETKKVRAASTTPWPSRRQRAPTPTPPWSGGTKAEPASA